MALTNVTQEIVRDSDAKVAAIKSETATEVAAIKAKAEAKVAELKESEDKRLADTIDRLRRQEESSGELESKKIVLAKKKEILSQVFDETLEELENAPADVKLAQYKSMVKYAKTIIPDPKAIISANDSFTAADLGVSSVTKDSAVAAGLILQSEDGTIEIDMQYSALLRIIRDRELKAVSDILFG